MEYSANKASDWILARAREKAQNEREGENDLIAAGVLKQRRFATAEAHIDKRTGWFLAEATMEWLDLFSSDMQKSIDRIEQGDSTMRDRLSNLEMR